MRSTVRYSLILVAVAALALGNVALAATTSVNIQNFAFAPSTVRIAPGDSVFWRNLDAVPHSVHWTSGGLADSPVLGQGGSFNAAFQTAGTYTYVCGIHGAVMSGSVVVGTVSATTPPATTAPATASPSPSPSPSAPPSASPTPSRSPSPAPSSAPPSASPSPTPTSSPLAAPASQANTLIGIVLVLIGVAILAGAFWWRFGTR